MRQAAIVILASVSVVAAAVALVAHDSDAANPDSHPTAYPVPTDLIGFEVFPFRAAGLSAHLRQSIAYNSGEQAVTVRWREADPVAPDTWYASQVVERTPFAVTSVASRNGGSVLYVAGIRMDGSDVVEEWTYAVRAGGYGIRQTSGAPRPIGRPMPPYSAEEFLNGDFSIPSADHNPAQRVTLYSGNRVGHVQSMAVDPEGRFALVRSHPSGALYRLEFSTNPATATLLYSSAVVPHLTAARTLEVRHNVAAGRTYILTERIGCLYFGEDHRTVLSDPDNDGVFDSWTTLSSAEWDAKGYENDSSWTDYDNLGVTFDW